MHDPAADVRATSSRGLALMNHRAAYVFTFVDSGVANFFGFPRDSLGFADDRVPDMTTTMPATMTSSLVRSGVGTLVILKSARVRRLQFGAQWHEQQNQRD